MTGLLLLVLLGAPAPAGAQEGTTIEAMASGLKDAEQLLKKKEGALKRAGILSPSGSVAGEMARVIELAEAAREKRPPNAPPADSRLGFGGAGAAAMGQLTGSPGAKSAKPGELEGAALNSRGQPTPDEIMAERIDLITDAKVSASVAREAFKRLLWVAYKAPEGAGATPEVQGLLSFLKGQLDAEVMGKNLWPVQWEGDMPPNILATYSGLIKVGPSFSRMGLVGKMTTMFHEMLHGHDDGGDESPIEHNRMRGAYAYRPDHPTPAMHNAAEMLAYTDMAQWVAAL
ncbi:MAG: hypothetical protein HYZ75_09650 [Elusimicrobia bacterium]|nr:hypothetical protein [Elusimicrobiota bacterium]